MEKNLSGTAMLAKLMFRLLPVQILLAAAPAVNALVAGFFASNFVGIDAVGAVGLYAPIGMLLNAISTMLVGGAVILCGKSMGRNEQDELHNLFSLDLIVSAAVSLLFTGAFLVLGFFDLTGFLVRDPGVRALLDRYMIGQALGVFPLLMGNQLTAFLSLENKSRRTLAASLVFMAVNPVLSVLFVIVLRLEALGLALASAGSTWAFFAVQAAHFLGGRSHFRLRLRGLAWGECLSILRVGLPGAASYGYQTVRGLAVNLLLEAYTGAAGLSAFAAANNFLGVGWAIPAGMLAVSRMMLSISAGEEDRRTLTDVMRVMLSRFLPLLGVYCAAVIVFAGPLTGIFFRDSAAPVHAMTAWGLRILPLCMPLSVIYMHFVCYGQIAGRQLYVHTLSALDGVICVAGFTALTIPFLGIHSVYFGNIFNGVVTVGVIVGWAWAVNRRFPRTMDELMIIPKDFGVPEDRRMDLTVRTMEEVVGISRQIQEFCLSLGIDERRAYLAALAMEEMAGNIVEHGFSKDSRPHSAAVRVADKDGELILRLRDDCVPFDPSERRKLAEGDDVMKNIGIRMVFRIARDVQYQNILGLNVLTIRI